MDRFANFNKRRIVTLSCGHALVQDKREAAASSVGTSIDCPKCGYVKRRITEMKWVTAKGGDRG